jgi:hypothetical protein
MDTNITPQPPIAAGQAWAVNATGEMRFVVCVLGMGPTATVEFREGDFRRCQRDRAERFIAAHTYLGRTDDMIPH